MECTASRLMHDSFVVRTVLCLVRSLVTVEHASILQVPADCANSIISGYLVIRARGGSGSGNGGGGGGGGGGGESSGGHGVGGHDFGGVASAKRWLLLLPDYVLYTFGSDRDRRALTATPMPGYSVASGTAELSGDDAVAERDREKTIRIALEKANSVFSKLYYFAGNSPEEVQRYTDCSPSCSCCCWSLRPIPITSCCLQTCSSLSPTSMVCVCLTCIH